MPRPWDVYCLDSEEVLKWGTWGENLALVYKETANWVYCRIAVILHWMGSQD